MITCKSYYCTSNNPQATYFCRTCDFAYFCDGCAREHDKLYPDRPCTKLSLQTLAKEFNPGASYVHTTVQDVEGEG